MTEIDARELLDGLIGHGLTTATGRVNTVVRLDGGSVVVATDRSPAGQAVPIAWVQEGINQLMADGELEISVPVLGHRSAFIGAVLLAIPGAALVSASPPRVRITDVSGGYRISEAGQVNAWWSGDRRQRFWLEITDRADIGIDLHCPQRDAVGKRNTGYSLIWWVERGDIVFHYDLNDRAIVAWSRAVGSVAEAPTVWLSHRGETRRRLQVARAKPGWWLDLDGPYPLGQPLTLTHLREHADDVRSVLERLKAERLGSLYFPFFFWGGRELRPMQPYLNKLPAELVETFPQLAAAVANAETPGPRSGSPRQSEVGRDYREARVSSFHGGREPFTVDPALVERGLQGHADTQNELALILQAAGIEPRSRQPQEPNYDLAWETNGTVFVAEIKSITDANEERQLRLGLGQVLRNRQRLRALGHQNVVALLVPERVPRDSTWGDLCTELGVVLLHRDQLGQAPTLRA